MINLSTVKLGLKSVKHDPLRLSMSHSILESLPSPPDAIDNTNGIESWGMMGNDEYNDCTMAGLGHSIEIATLNTGIIQVPSLTDILKEYSSLCGYDPLIPSTDQGGVLLDILDTLTKSNTTFCGRKLLGYVSPDPKNIDHVKKAIAYFGSVCIGASIPSNVQHQKIWQAYKFDGGSEGLHCMINGGYTSEYIPFITWGMNQPATWLWWTKYVEECHVLLWDVWLKKFPASNQKTILDIMNRIS